MSLDAPNRETFLELTTKYRRELKNVARQYCIIDGEADDIVQEAVMHCYENLDRFDPALSSLKSWLTRVVISTALNVTEREKRRRGISVVHTDFPEGEHTENTRRAKAKPKPEEEPGYDPQTDLRISVHQALAKLTDKERSAAEAILLRGETLEDYAEDEGINVPSAKLRLDTAKTRLRKLLQEFET